MPASLSPRKVILALILVASTLFLFLILGIGAIAILHEAAPTNHPSLAHVIAAVRHVIAHHNPIPHHK